MTEINSDETIMQNIKNGELAGMSVLFERYHLRLFNFFLKMGLKREISQDLTQNLFYRLLKYRNSYKDDKPMSINAIGGEIDITLSDLIRGSR